MIVTLGSKGNVMVTLRWQDTATAIWNAFMIDLRVKEWSISKKMNPYRTENPYKMGFFIIKDKLIDLKSLQDMPLSMQLPTKYYNQFQSICNVYNRNGNFTKNNTRHPHFTWNLVPMHDADIMEKVGLF